jgi:hypothetical protein
LFKNNKKVNSVAALPEIEAYAEWFPLKTIRSLNDKSHTIVAGGDRDV